MSTENKTQENQKQEHQKQEHQKQEQRKQDQRQICRFFVKVILIAALVWVLCGFVFSFSVMRGEDMYPRLRDGDILISYRLDRAFAVGDVVIFRRDGESYAGRIVARAGDVVEMDEKGNLLVNGAEQSEQIFYPTYPADTNTYEPVTVGEDAYYLLGDFRTNAVDSRIYGCVREDEIIGKVFTVIRRRGI